MTRSAKRRDETAPSLFPFLAVLLCTMGALVLILMLSVSGAQTATHQMVSKLEQEVELEEAKIQLAKEGLTEKLEESRIQLEKKRLALQHLEEHIRELTEELQQIHQQMQLAEASKDSDNTEATDREQQITELEKQLADATKELQQKLEEPDGDKPIFAIIPYDGPNGTHRRPIYLECTAKGVVIQPEGVLIPASDLRPPYGPGNPLDAALRTIRAEFPSKNGSVTSNPYPLLIVRPSGIKHYMMARAAMSGWDDQFGYELVSEDLDLAYPPSLPQLPEKIAQALEVARQRQSALVMAMPQHYAGLEPFADELSMGAGGEFEDSDDWAEGDSAVLSEAGVGGTNATRPAAFTFGPGGNSDAGLSSSNAGRSDPPAGSDLSSILRPLNAMATTGPTGLATAGRGVQGYGSQIGQGNSLSSDSSTGGFEPGFASATSSDIGSGNGGRPSQAGNSLFGARGSDSFGEAGAGGSETMGAGSAGSGASGNGSSTFSASSSSESTFGASGNGHSGQSGQAGGAGGNASGMAAAASASAVNSPLPGNWSSNNSQSNSVAGSQQSSMNLAASTNADGLSSPRSGATDQDRQSPAIDPNTPIPTNLNVNVSRRAAEMARPLAMARGANWAWDRPQRTQTAVIRSIRVRCYNDRWVILPEKGSNRTPETILFEGTPVDRAERLAKVVRRRVEGWGVALAGGHWTPVLHVDVASDADWRFDQLQRLMEGSGIDVQRKETISPAQP